MIVGRFAARIGADEGFRNALRATARTRYETEFSPDILATRFLDALGPAL